MMKTFLLHGRTDLRFTEKPIPSLAVDQVLIQTKVTGICGSDVHYFKHGYCGNFMPKQPFALGHEFAGVVHQIGVNVQDLKLGDEVAVDPSMPCGTCSYCKSGQYNLCMSMRFLGSAGCDSHIDDSMVNL